MKEALILVFAMWLEGEPPMQPDMYMMESNEQCEMAKAYAYQSAVALSQLNDGRHVNYVAECVSPEDMGLEAI